MLIAAIAVTGIVIGIAIGAVGIGGVLLVPFLTLTLGIDVKHAIAAALLSYLPGCVVAVWLYARRGSIPWREAALLCLAALPTAWLGARAAQHAPAGLLEAGIGVLLLAGGIYALLPVRRIPTTRRRLAAPTLLVSAAHRLRLGADRRRRRFVLPPVLLLLDTGAGGDRHGAGDHTADRRSLEPCQYRRRYHGSLAGSRYRRDADARDCDRHPDRACIAATSVASPSGFSGAGRRACHAGPYGGTAVNLPYGKPTT